MHEELTYGDFFGRQKGYLTKSTTIIIMKIMQRLLKKKKK